MPRRTPSFDELFGDAKENRDDAFDPKPVTLETPLVRLEPLTIDHAPELFKAGKAPTLWRYMPVPPPRNVDDMEAWMRAAIEEAERGECVPFAIVHKEEGRAVGSTRYMDIQRKHRSIEIGWTWVGLDYQRTFVNTHAKFLLFQHAFENLNALRVQLKTDSRNRQSQKALDRVGAVREGRLRNHRVLHDGYVRDTVIYSVTAKEWPEVKRQLQLRLL